MCEACKKTFYITTPIYYPSAKLHIGHHAVMDVMPYQLEPAAMSLSRPRQRILMADGVGLGKTLEAGILISELIARG